MNRNRKLVVLIFSIAAIIAISQSLVINQAIAQTPTLGAASPLGNDPASSSVPTFSAPRSTPTAPWIGPYYQVPLAISPHDHFLFSQPVASENSALPKPEFGYGYLYPDEDLIHTGTDFVAKLRQPVYAAAAGKVVFSGYGLLNGTGDKDDPYGIAVMLRHSFSYDGQTIYTVYAHLDKTLVTVGQSVKIGDTIGQIGTTGFSSGPHLHFEVRLQKNKETRIQNPELWLVPPIGNGVLSGKIINNYGYFLGAKEILLRSLDTGKSRVIITYAPAMEKRDEFFQENYVLNNLPAGQYEISTYYYYKYYKTVVTIVPGTVNYVNFEGNKGFIQAAPILSDPTGFLH